MPIKSDRWIKKMSQEHGMIEPFADRQVRAGAVSFGVSSYGYDFRISNEFKLINQDMQGLILDPKSIQPDAFKTVKTDDYIILPAQAYVLSRSIEYFRIPRNILTICFGKSTYARCGVVVNITPFEPEWEGFVTMAISNTSALPVKLYANEGIAQLLFLESDSICEISYADKKGKYQKQDKIELAKV
ncbi:MAG: dCTP deaminase [bacterium]